jgi:twitching motility protein PilT
MPTVDTWLREMLAQGGSDLHLSVGRPPRVRVHGELVPMAVPSVDEESLTRILHEICPESRWETFKTSGDVDFAYEITGVARFRSNYFRDHCGSGAVLRQIPARIQTLEELHLPDVIGDVCEYRRGLVFVTGATGSGKSTTMAAMVDRINRMHHRHIITIEDPVEFVHVNQTSVIVQREVGEHTESFAAALASAMRADPDVILVGEIRDRETMRLVLDCAAMGMLVFATLHTSGAAKTIDRVIDMFPADEQDQVRTVLGEGLVGVISQVLCRTADGRGRVAAHEILLYTEALPNTIWHGQMANLEILIETGRGKGMCSLESALRGLLEQGVITPAEAYVKANAKEQFAAQLPVEALLQEPT